MRPSRAVSCTALVSALLAAQPAAAKDRCFSLPGLSGFVTYALKSFAPPARNKCKPLTGLSLGTPGYLLDGTVCRTSDGAAVRLALAGHGVVVGPAPFQGGCTIPMPSLTGGSCLGTFTSGSTHIGWTSSIDLAPCVATVP